MLLSHSTGISKPFASTGQNSVSQPCKDYALASLWSVTSERGKLRLENLIENMQKRLCDRVKSKTKASLILCFTGNVHLPWKDHCLLQLRATGSAKARGNVIGQWLSGKRYSAISTSASQLDLFCLMAHMGKAGSFRI